MRVKFTFLIIFLVISFNSTHAQNNEECSMQISIFHEYVKAKNFDAAFEPWMYVRNNCPKLNIAIYSEGEDILESKINGATGDDKTKFLNDLLKLWKERAIHFPNKTNKGKYAAKACQLVYDNKNAFSNTDLDLYTCFNTVYKENRTTFTNPKSLYTYFSLMVNLYDNDLKPAQDLFNTYDDVIEKIEVEVKNYSEKLNALITKMDNDIVLTKKEKAYKRFYETSLKQYSQITKSIEKISSARSNCDNLISLYRKGFESHKTNAIWLKRAVNKMYHKQCTEDSLYEKIVIAFDKTAPSADTKYFVATVLFQNNKPNEGENYLKQAYNLETDAYKKGKLAYKIGILLKNKKKYSKARIYFRNALKLNPSNGSPHLSIAAMYKSSAKDCGDSNFYQRAVYWLAAKEAQKALRVDPTLKKDVAQSLANYKALAPTKQEVFIKNMSGKTIKIGCWIQSSIKVPSI